MPCKMKDIETTVITTSPICPRHLTPPTASGKSGPSMAGYSRMLAARRRGLRHTDSSTLCCNEKGVQLGKGEKGSSVCS